MIRLFKKSILLLKGIFSDRRLLFSLAFKDFKRRFAGSYFGAAWGFIQPLLNLIVYWAVFQFGFRSGTDTGIPFVLWFMAGLIPWLFVAECITASSNSFLDYSYLVKKVVFNIDILPLVKIFSAFFIHICFLGILSIICAIFGFYPSIYLFQILYYMFCTVSLVYAIALIFSSVIVFFRDLNQMIGILLLMGMWGTPIAWSFSMVKDERLQFIFKLNPFYYIVEGYRDAFVQHAWFWNKNSTIGFWVVVVILFTFGTFVYTRLKPHFADTL